MAHLPFFEGTEAGKQQVAAAVRQAGEQVGFMFIINHGIQAPFQEQVLQVARDFFDLPEEEKKEICMTADYPYGYTSMGEEILSRSRVGRGVADLKETFQICLGPEENPSPSMPQPQWPRRPEEFREVMTAYYRSLEGLGLNLMRICAIALDLPENYFDKSLNQHWNSLRLLNYPEQSEEPLPGQLRASPHTDYGSLTILLQDDIGGLQVQKRDDTWVDAISPPGAYVINFGDAFQRWTNDRWKSTMHQVVNSSKLRRQSIAYFQNLNRDAVIECFPSCQDEEHPAKYPPITAGEHLMLKHEAAMGRGKPVEDERNA